MNTNQHINVKHGSRTPEQRAVMEQIAKDGVCPFCRDFCEGNSPLYHTKPILRETEHWVFTENFQLYEGAQYHWILVLKRHARTFSELTLEEWDEVFELVSGAEQEYGIPGGALFMRFGDTNFTVGSVEHLHIQLLSGASKEEGGEPIFVGLGYKKKS